jgi:hypothetical protein
MNYIVDVAQRIRREVPPELMPEGDADPLFLMYALLALALGEKVRARDVHDAWAAWMSQQNPAHESIKPFDDLDEETQAQDKPFAEAIRRVSAYLR